MKSRSLKEWRLIKTLLLFFLITVGYLYIAFFKDSLANGDWLSTNGYARIIIPDTLLYSGIVDVNNIIESIQMSGIKNTIIPSFLWVISGFDWVNLLLINIGMVYLIAFYMERLAKQYQIPLEKARLAVVVFLLLPTTFYYSIGALKELPMALLILASLYYYNINKFKIFLLIVLILFMVRYQLIFIILLLFLSKISHNSIRTSILLILLISSIYPLISFLTIFSQDTTEAFRYEYGVAGSLGSIVENIRNNYIFLSTFSILIRTFQSLFEPIIVFFKNQTFYESGDLSVWTIIHLPSNILISPYLYLFVKKNIFIYKNNKYIFNDVQTPFAFLTIALIFIGGFAFIHGRYLIPLYPLIIIASLIPYERMGSSNILVGTKK